MNSDYHIHSYYSGDSDTPMEEMVKTGISLGLSVMCFTEHYDEDFPKDIGDFSLDTERYYQEFCFLKEKYSGQIELLFGVELGMQPHLGEIYGRYAKNYPFDYILASQHLVGRQDPYYASFWSGKDPAVLICRYLEETLENLRLMQDYDALGHLDYIIRYSGKTARSFSWRAYADYIDPILRYLIENGKCLEVNTAGLKYGLGHPNPREDILSRYRELGGELLTIGSDGHKPEHLAYDFPLLPDLLKSLGFTRYCIFRQRKPEYLSL